MRVRFQGGRSIGIVLFFCLILSPLGYAEDDKPAKWGVGLGVGWINDYPGAAQGRIRYLPFPVYRGENVRIDRLSGVSGDVYKENRWDFTWNFIFQFPMRSEWAPIREGMPDLDWLLSLGPEVNYDIWRKKRHRLIARFPVRLNGCTNFGNRSRFCGVSFNPGLRHIYLHRRYGEFTWRAEALSHSQEYQNYFYQVEPVYATARRPAFEAQAGFQGFIYGFFHTLPFDGWELATTATVYDYSLAINQDSPLFLHKTNFALFLAVTVDLFD